MVITKQLVEMMGGRVWVESEVGQGSCFLFEIDCIIAEAGSVVSDRRVQAEPVHPGLRKTDSIRGARVLLVEDNAINQLVARNFLEIDGVVVDIANNGIEGVQKALTGQYALVLMDIQMPEMDGLQATRKIRATAGFENLPIVAMTANAMTGDRQLSLDAGMNAHITKPIDKNLLTQTLLQWIPACAVAHEGEPPGTSAPADGNTNTIDMETAIKRLGGSREFYLEIVAAFCTESAEQLAALRQQIEHSDKPGALRSVHTLKGLAATVGATALSLQAAHSEQELKAMAEPPHPQTPQVQAMVQALETQLSASLLALQEIMSVR